MSSFVTIINGYAESGKDQFVNHLVDSRKLMIVNAEDLPVVAMSSIDPVRNMLRAAGFDVDNKTPEMRRILAEVGSILVNWRITKCLEFVKEQILSGPKHVFIHMREPNNITTLVGMLHARGIPVDTLLVRRPGFKGVNSNKADMEVEQYDYATIIDNDGSLSDLWMLAERYAKRVQDSLPSLQLRSH